MAWSMALRSESFWVSFVTVARSLWRPLRMIWAWVWVRREKVVVLLMRFRKKLRLCSAEVVMFLQIICFGIKEIFGFQLFYSQLSSVEKRCQIPFSVHF